MLPTLYFYAGVVRKPHSQETFLNFHGTLLTRKLESDHDFEVALSSIARKVRDEKFADRGVEEIRARIVLTALNII